MAGVKISGLPALPSAAGTDLYATVQGGVTYKGTVTQLQTFFQSNLSFLPLAGGTMTGAINMGSHQINALTDPTLAQDAATKAYVDAVAQGLTIQGACRLATTGALTATYNNVSVSPSGVGATLTNAGAQIALSLDGVAAVVNDRVLIKNQASALQNGIYTVTNIGSGATNWILTRATDYDQPAEINPGDLVVITAGNTLSNSSWLETATVNSVGVDSISFSQFSAALPISLANGGTGAALTASNGGIFYSGASAGAILAGTATAGLALLSGANTTPSWSAAPPLTKVNIQVFTVAGANTYTPTAGTKFAIVEVVGGGGGGGGVATAGAGTCGAGQSGGGGGYSRKLVTAATIGASQTVTIGAAGTAGASAAGAGGTGGTTSFGAIVTATGGGGGSGTTAGATVSVANGSNGGTGASGDFNMNGGSSGNGFCLAAGALAMAANGGGTALSPTGEIGQFATGNTSAAGGGPRANEYGAGGSGAAVAGAGASAAGGAGLAGICIVTEFISV